MTELVFRSDMTVELIDSMASDAAVVRAARVSTKGADSREQHDAGAAGLIRYLMKNRHGSPFEHAVFTFYVEAPIFVFRELMRHRIASYNEESARYRELAPVFYVPADDRPLVQVGKAGEYRFEAGTETQHDAVASCARYTSRTAYDQYRALLAHDVAREVARMVLPVSIYSSAYVTINARSLMNLLSLRTKREGSAYPSFPQREIELVAEGFEDHFVRRMPVTHAFFCEAGRVAP